MSMTTAQIYLVLVMIPCLIALWKDLSEMRIPNLVSLAMIVIFAVTAPFLMEWQDIVKQVGLAVVVFVVLFGLYLLGGVGAGDVKFASTIMLFVQLSDVTFFIRNLGLIALAGLCAHMIVRRIEPLRNLAPHWRSFNEQGVFPYGLALSVSLIFYLVTKIL